MVGRLRWAQRRRSPRSARVATWWPHGATTDGQPQAIAATAPRPAGASLVGEQRGVEAQRSGTQAEDGHEPGDPARRWWETEPDDGGDRTRKRRGPAELAAQDERPLVADDGAHETAHHRARRADEHGHREGRPGGAGDPRTHDAEEREPERSGPRADAR
jgi:hypothetical protein